MAEDSLTLYETPEGAIALSDRHGRSEISVYRPDGAEVVTLKIVARPLGKDREYYQIIRLDPHCARHVASLLWSLASNAGANHHD